jgi:hypothetical protein
VSDEAAAEHPLVQFKILAVQTNEILLMASTVVARMILRLEGSESSSIDPFSSFVQEPWDTVAQSPAGADPAELRGALRSLCDDTARLLREAFGAVPGEPREAMAAFVSADRVSRIVGMFEQNQLGIRCRSPLRPWVESALRAAEAGGFEELGRLAPYLRDLARQESSQEEEEAWESEGEEEGGSTAEAVNRSALLEEMSGLVKTSGGEAEVDPLFQPLDGTALFTTTCVMNHACSPNVVVCWADAAVPAAWHHPSVEPASPSAPLTLEVFALRDIAAGEELCFAYISKDLPRAERKRALAEYGFACKCKLCFKGLK